MLQEALARTRKLQMTPGSFWESFPETLLETFPETFQSLSGTLARQSMWRPVRHPFLMPTRRSSRKPFCGVRRPPYPQFNAGEARTVWKGRACAG